MFCLHHYCQFWYLAVSYKTATEYFCKRGLRRHAVSVSPSVTLVNSVKTNKHIFNLFSPSDSQTILAFPYQTLWQYSDRDPLLTAASNESGVDTNRDSGRIAGYRWTAAADCDQQLTVVGAVVYHSYGARLFTAQRPPRIKEYAVEKRSEQNRI